MYKIYIESNSPEYTIKIGNNLAKLLSKGDVVVLSGDLGAGKTKFVEGFLHNFGLQDEISSPTFNIINEYISSDNNIYHFDVYRLGSGEELIDAGAEDYFYGDGVSVVEWADLVMDYLPEDAIVIHISYGEKEGERVYRCIF